MASISTCFAVTAKTKFRHSSCDVHSLNCSLFCSSLRFNSSSFYTSILLRQRFQNPRVHFPVTRAGIEIPDAIKPGNSVETDKLPSDVRNRAMEAVDSCGGRVTIGDVASKAGLKLNETQKALQALAADTGGFLEVSDEGDVLYVFPKDYRSKLSAKSFRMRVEPFLGKAKSAVEYLIRVSFGTALIASIVIVYTTIIALLSSRSEEDNRGRRGGRSYDSGFTVFLRPSDLFWYWDPYYYRRRQIRTENDGMNFIESVFSFVFGDGDPNQGIEEERWKLIGQYIASNGGVITAEELAPYLDVQPTEKTAVRWQTRPSNSRGLRKNSSQLLAHLYALSAASLFINTLTRTVHTLHTLHTCIFTGATLLANLCLLKILIWVIDLLETQDTLHSLSHKNDESYILPVLLRFDGYPEVDDEGNILYRFPSLQRTASSQRIGRREYVGKRWADWVGGVEKFFKEKKWQFSKTGTSETAMVMGLGGLNLFGVIILGTMLKNTTVTPSGFISFVADIFPLLQIYAGSFFAIPLFRWFLLRKRNAEIEERNKAREQRAQALELPDLPLRRKLLSARDMAQRTVIGPERIVYSTERDLYDQDYEAREWDQRFREIERSD